MTIVKVSLIREYEINKRMADSLMIRYCTKRLRIQDGKEYYTNIFSHEKAVKMCTNSSEKILKVDVREAKNDEETPYVGWLDSEGNISLIFPNLTLLEVCFPYGTKAEIERGRGRIIRVIIKEIGE